MPNALITGIRGQDGAYLARLLLDKGYTVWGAVRPQSTADSVSALGKEFVVSPSLAALGITDEIRLVTIDYVKSDSLERAIDIAMPDEVYNLAAQSSVARSFDAPVETGEVTGLGTARLLHAIHKVSPRTRFYQASSSEMFGVSPETPQNENTTFHPRSPYGVAKVYAHWMTVNYREAFCLYACNGILFNHESPLRPEQFVTRKICSAVARIKMGMQKELMLGNIEVERDWGFAGDYVEAMYLMLQQKQANDYVIATGKTHSLKEFVTAAFKCVDLDYRDWVRTDPLLHRPSEVRAVVGDARRAHEEIGWKPKVSFNELVMFLVEAEMRRTLEPVLHLAFPRNAAPETGYGYIEQGATLDESSFRVARFVEKPDAARAQEFVASGRFLWNSGMFLLPAKLFLQELQTHAPEVYAAAQAALSGAQRDLDFCRPQEEAFLASPSVSVDYAVMERTQRAAVVPSSFGWSDVGSYSALWEVEAKDAHGNATQGEVVLRESRGCFVRTEKQLVAMLGVEDLVVVATADAILVASKACAQNVKLVVDELKKQGRAEPEVHKKVYRPWGWYEGVERGERFQVKQLMVKPGQKSSMQVHHHRSEHWIIVKGTAKVTLGEEEKLLTEDQSIYIPLGVPHRIFNPGRIPLHFVEVQSGSYLEEDDITRLDDQYGRQ